MSLEVPGAEGDRDEKGIVLESFEAANGFVGYEQFIYRTAALRTGKHDEPSAPGDLDLTLYSLKKFLRLAMQGNPDATELLFMRDYVKLTPTGKIVQDLAPDLVSKQSGRRYLGYMESQRQKLLGERGQKRVTRTELDLKHGYDTKYAYHIIRLGFHGVELLQTGKLSLPMKADQCAYIMSIRKGEVPMQDMLTKAGELERDVKDLIDGGSFLQDEPDRKMIEADMLDLYRQAWKET